jgi:aminopeptidase N
MWGVRIRLHCLLRDAFYGVPFFLFLLALISNGDIFAQSRYLIFPEQTETSSWKSPDARLNSVFAEEPFSDSTHSFDALRYSLNLKFPMQSAYYYGSMTLDLQVADSIINSITLDMIDMIADSVFNGTGRAEFTQDDSTINISLSGDYQFSDTISVQIFYHKNNSGVGYYHYDRNTYTITEPRDARYWFPCFDVPWDKALSDLAATVPENRLVASNGILDYVANNPADHTTTYYWVNNQQIATYLISFIIGEMASWTDYYIGPGNDSLPIYNICWREDSAKAAFDFENVPDMISVFSRLFGPYPFDKYGQGAVQPFPIGGMENQTMTTMNRTWITGDRLYEFGIAHELAHMWWGDYVTLSDWPHIWLNEGFATYASALYNEAHYGAGAFAENMAEDAAAYFEYDERVGRNPLYNPRELFGVPEYSKGSWVLHMLRGIIGDDTFFAGLREYARRYGYGNASTSDFQQVMEETSHRDLEWFFQEWIYEQGYPEYYYAWNDSASGDNYHVHLEIAQFQNNAPAFTMPLKIRVIGDSDYDFMVTNDRTFQSYDFVVDSKPFEVVIDPDNWVLKKVRPIDSNDHPDRKPIPDFYTINSVYPNPFNSRTTIEIELTFGSNTEISAYDIQGRLIRRIYSGYLTTGKHRVIWDGFDENHSELASGTYFIKLSARHHSSVAKITCIK